MRSNFDISVVRCSRPFPLCTTAVLSPTDSRLALRLICPCVCLASLFSAFIKHYSKNASSLPLSSPPTQVSHSFASLRIGELPIAQTCTADNSSVTGVTGPTYWCCPRCYFPWHQRMEDNGTSRMTFSCVSNLSQAHDGTRGINFRPTIPNLRAFCHHLPFSLLPLISL